MRSTPLFAAILFATASAAHAGPGTSPESVEKVPFEASELTSEEGVRSVKSRIRRAAYRVCQFDRLAVYNQRTCVTPAALDGFAQLDRLVAQGRSRSMANAGTITIRAR